MIKTLVITKINRSIISPYKPVEVMVGFYDKNGELIGSQLMDASLFENDIIEGQKVDFKKPISVPSSLQFFEEGFS